MNAHRILPFLLLVGGIARGEETRDLILIAGQSNSVGYDALPKDLPADPGDRETMFWWRCGDPPPDVHDSTSGRVWTHLQPQPRGNPLKKDSGEKGEAQFGLNRQYGNFAVKDGGFGPEIGLARELKARGGKPIAIVKASFSGTGMRTDWNPEDEGDGGLCYRALVAEVRDATVAAKAKGVTLRLRALVWVQGESDANAKDAPKYEENLTRMLKRLRRDLDAPNLVALLAVNTRFGNGKNPFVPKVVEAQKEVAAKNPPAAYVDTASAETLPPSHTHFTSKGTLDIGRRFAAELLKVEASKGR